MRIALRIVAITTILSGFLLAPLGASAQERYRLRIDMPAAQTKYTYQHILDVGDIPGHQIRMYDIQRIYGDNAPTYRGVRALEELNRGQSDMINGNGQSAGYGTTVLANGDRIFFRFSGTILTVEGEGGTRQATYNGTGTYVGGTGEFKAMRGTLRSTSILQLKDGKVVSNQTLTDAEYWFEQ